MQGASIVAVLLFAVAVNGALFESLRTSVGKWALHRRDAPLLETIADIRAGAGITT